MSIKKPGEKINITWKQKNKSNCQKIKVSFCPRRIHESSKSVYLIFKGIKIVALSLGKEGAVVASNGGIWSASPPKIKVVNSVGSGDALVAGFIYSFTKGEGMEEAIRLGMACALANALISGAGLCQKEAIEKSYNRLVIESIPSG